MTTRFKRGMVVITALLSLGVMGAGAALASQSSIIVTQQASPGVAGYYGANDNWTHYRFVKTTVQAEPTLINLNGQTDGPVAGGIGVELCDNDTGFIAQTGLLATGTVSNPQYEVLFAYGNVTGPTLGDPCIQTGLLQPNVASCLHAGSGWHAFGALTCGEFGLGNIATGDHVYLGVYYDPSGNHQHQISFGDCVTETHKCQQAWTESRYQQEFWEFGVGAVTGQTALTGGAINQVDSFTSTDVTCYFCSHMVPFGEVQSVTGFGGLSMDQFVNSSDQVEMSPSSIFYPSSADSFNLLEGSTSA